jgi:hypothetical protein
MKYSHGINLQSQFLCIHPIALCAPFYNNKNVSKILYINMLHIAWKRLQNSLYKHVTYCLGRGIVPRHSTSVQTETHQTSCLLGMPRLHLCPN